MLRRWLFSIGLAATLAGFATLGTSLYMWTQAGHRLFYTERDERWVRTDSSGAPAIDRDETWEVSAACQRPYFVEAAAQATAKLKAYGETAPEEIRAWRNHAQVTQEGRAESAASDEGVELHAKYQDWFLAEFKLDKQLKQWERRLGALTDRSTSLREAHDRITDVRLYISEEAGLAGAGRDFEHFVYFLLGLGGFPDEQMTAIKAACIKTVPIKLIVTATTWHSDIERWPRDQAFMFRPAFALTAFGLALLAATLLSRRRRVDQP
jgi:hypothetical protein